MAVAWPVDLNQKGVHVKTRQIISSVICFSSDVFNLKVYIENSGKKTTVVKQW